MSKYLYLIYYHLSLDITTTPTLNHDTKGGHLVLAGAKDEEHRPSRAQQS
jgi:hypothetical protein